MPKILEMLKQDDAPPAPMPDPHGIRQKLEDALAAIGEGDSAEQQLCLNLMSDAVYLSHLISCRQYTLDNALTGISRMNLTLGRFMGYLVAKRPKVDMFGVATGDTLLPVAFQSKAEADGFRTSVVSTPAETVVLELTTSAINPSLQPVITAADPELGADEVAEIEDLALKLKSMGAGDPAANVPLTTKPLALSPEAQAAVDMRVLEQTGTFADPRPPLQPGQRETIVGTHVGEHE